MPAKQSVVYVSDKTGKPIEGEAVSLIIEVKGVGTRSLYLSEDEFIKFDEDYGWTVADKVGAASDKNADAAAPSQRKTTRPSVETRMGMTVDEREAAKAYREEKSGKTTRNDKLTLEWAEKNIPAKFKAYEEAEKAS